MKQQLKMPPVLYDTVALRGGMDEISPNIMLPPGMARDSINFECSILGGYSRIEGYERYDGHALPSSKVFQTVYIASFVNIPVAGNTITGQTSGATGYVLTAGPNYVVISEVTGVFQIAETIKVGATVIGTSALPSGSISALLRATYTGLAADRQRTYISAVPGTGSVRGVFVYNDLVYAFRDTGGNSLLYVESASGWTLVPFFYELGFTAGTGLPAEGVTITQGGVTAVLKRVARESGAWTGGAAGRFIIAAPAGGNFAAGAATAPGSTFTLTGIQTAITLPGGSMFEFAMGNFSGSSVTERVYGCNGAGRCFEFDGTILVPINSGVTPDTPKHILMHKNFLFTSAGSLLVFSAPGLPYNHAVAEGAGTFSVGSDITNLIELPGAQTTAAMGVWTREDTQILYGTTAATFNLVPLNTGCGGLHYTARNMAHTYVMDDRGVIDMQQSLVYGNFEVDTISFRLNNFIAQKRQRVISSSLNRRKSQYRLFFNDGTGLYITSTHGEQDWQNVGIGAMPIRFANSVTCVFEDRLSTGDEVTYFGSDNGMVYKMDSGTSFDGAAIDARLVLVYNSTGSPRLLKRYRHMQIEYSATAFFQAQFGYMLGYNNTAIIQPSYTTYQTNVLDSSWDSFVWDNFQWDGVSIVPFECEMNGTAENYAAIIQSSSAIFSAFTIHSMTAHYTPRRGKR